MENAQTWYIVKQASGNCKIVPNDQITENDPNVQESWGPFTSPDEAITRRIGLIRSGKCQPV